MSVDTSVGSESDREQWRAAVAGVLALTGKNRARWSGKLEESEVFSEWLAAH